jgi:hypothetical protein
MAVHDQLAKTAPGREALRQRYERAAALPPEERPADAAAFVEAVLLMVRWRLLITDLLKSAVLSPYLPALNYQKELLERLSCRYGSCSGASARCSPRSAAPCGSASRPTGS